MNEIDSLLIFKTDCNKLDARENHFECVREGYRIYPSVNEVLCKYYKTPINCSWKIEPIPTEDSQFTSEHFRFWIPKVLTNPADHLDVSISFSLYWQTLIFY